MKILAMPNTKNEFQDFHGGGKTTALICYRNKKGVPNKLQKSVISWYHTTLCHPGINRTEETTGQHLWWQNMCTMPKRQAIVIFPEVYYELCLGMENVKRETWRQSTSSPKIGILVLIMHTAWSPNTSC
jgi:hypothetical protein